MSELLILDPSEVALNRVELDLTKFVASAGPDWGDAAIEQYMALAERGQVPIDFRIPNRVIRIPLLLLDRGAVAFEEIREDVQAKAALIQRRGGWLKRDTPVGPVYADLVGATLKFGGSTLQALYDIDADAFLELQALPDFYGDEIDLGTVTSTDGHAIWLIDNVEGNYQARTRIVVTDLSGHRQHGLVFGFRSRHYSSAATAELVYEAEDLTPLDETITETTTPPAEIIGWVNHPDLSIGWTPVLSTEIDGVGHMTHTGTYRIWARLRTTAETPPRARFVYDVGDLVRPEENAAQRLPGPDEWYLMNLGQVRLDPAPVGAHRWIGQIQGAGDEGGEDLHVEKIWLVPVDDGYGTLRSPIDTRQGVLEGFTARDGFDQTSGALNGKTLPVGGTWTTSGDATDFNVASSAANRNANSDVALTGRYAIAGTTVLTDTVVEAEVVVEDIGPSLSVIARYADDSNWVKLTARPEDTSDEWWVRVSRCIGGAETILHDYLTTGVPRDEAVTIRLRVTEGGLWLASAGQSEHQLADPILSGYDNQLATGGTLEDGKVGIYDEWTGPDAGLDREYRRFAAWAPVPDAVVHASQAAELRWDGMFRQDPTGSSYGPVSYPVGALPRLPPSGPEAVPTQVMVKVSRGDLDELPDLAIDDLAAQALIRPCWLYVPDTVVGS